MAQQGVWRAIRHQLDLEEVLVVEKEHVWVKDVAPINLAKIKLQCCLQLIARRRLIYQRSILQICDYLRFLGEEYHDVSCTEEFCLYLFLSTQSQPKGGALIGSQRCDNWKLRFACFFQELLLSVHAFRVGLDKDGFGKVPGCENLEEF